MPTAVSLIEDPGGTPTTHLDVRGIVLEGILVAPRSIQEKLTKFWGVDNESYIFGGRGGRDIHVPVLIYDNDTEDEDYPRFDTSQKLADYIAGTLNGSKMGFDGQLTITSQSNYSPFDDCRFGGAALVDGPKHDDAGLLGGQYWAICVLMFRQLS